MLMLLTVRADLEGWQPVAAHPRPIAHLGECLVIDSAQSLDRLVVPGSPKRRVFKVVRINAGKFCIIDGRPVDDEPFLKWQQTTRRT